MSIDSLLGGVTSLSNQVQTGIGTVLKTGSDLGIGGLRDKYTPWFSQLQGASFRGVGFQVIAGDASFGRRVVTHEYPFRDKVWVEDLGRAARRFEIQGFLVGEDCIAQRDAMIAVCERKDSGDSKLVHPSMGEMNVALLGRLKVNERWDKGRMFEISFSFIESGKQQFPNDQQSGIATVTVVGKRADQAAAATFASKIKSALKTGAAAVQTAVNVTKAWTATAQRLSNDATNLVNMVSSIGGAVGRFANGRNVGGLTSQTSLAASSAVSVASLVAQGSSARTLVDSLIATANANAANLSAGTTADFAASVQSLVQAVSASVTNPADAARLLTGLAQAASTAPASGASLSLAQQSALGATSDLLRRAAVVQIARASQAYQPASVEDAAALRAAVCASLDAEITVAGDEGADDVYNTLRELRTAVSADLTARGAGLPTTATVSSALPLPSLVLAQRLYRDSSRADELVIESNCIHPAFMPTSFKALSQ